MKRFKLILICAPIFLVALSSCKKKIYGCMDATADNYSPVATEDLENCTYSEPEPDEVYSSTLSNGSWTLDGNQYKATVYWSEITQDIMDNGGVLAYIRIAGNTVWEQIPMTFYQSASYSTSIGISYVVGQARMTWTDSDLTAPATPPSVDVKLIILR